MVTQKNYKPANILMFSGAVILISAGIYGLAFWGGTPDGSPDWHIWQDTHETVTGSLCGLGLCMLVIGILWRIILYRMSKNV